MTVRKPEGGTRPVLRAALTAFVLWFAAVAILDAASTGTVPASSPIAIGAIPVAIVIAGWSAGIQTGTGWARFVLLDLAIVATLALLTVILTHLMPT
jgi:hypothetical protein